MVVDSSLMVTVLNRTYEDIIINIPHVFNRRAKRVQPKSVESFHINNSPVAFVRDYLHRCRARDPTVKLELEDIKVANKREPVHVVCDGEPESFTTLQQHVIETVQISDPSTTQLQVLVTVTYLVEFPFTSGVELSQCSRSDIPMKESSGTFTGHALSSTVGTEKMSGTGWGRRRSSKSSSKSRRLSWEAATLADF
eukprot:CAMPEP_0118935342 /NCGR_PEP_ID=MMETSP1169-20130426/15474_1 /TAXON_ID=36882 /ORGANISM="Pyramimonas obovata, Strain CCMP722" /LENGTH=195 /DNA_ID=CAMNT_0006878361 /DNA_START=61 /DNA_END=651 /DNA_ORIENTATION=+